MDKLSPNLVPTFCVGMQVVTLCITERRTWELVHSYTYFQELLTPNGILINLPGGVTHR